MEFLEGWKPDAHSVDTCNTHTGVTFQQRLGSRQGETLLPFIRTYTCVKAEPHWHKANTL